MNLELTERQKDYLRTIVKLIREENLDEEFRIIYDADGIARFFARRQNEPKMDGSHWGIPGLSKLTLDALTQGGYIFSVSELEDQTSEFGGSTTTRTYERKRHGYVTPKGYRSVDNNFSPVENLVLHHAPGEISSSLERFRCDYPDPTRLAFIMMQFGATKAHQQILSSVRSSLQTHGFIALRADDKEYHDDLFFNILTYIYGCRFGIAIFERIEDNSFNPNVSLEVGYMTGIGKPVCYLKDKTLPSLQTDLIGKLYRQFDSFDPQSTIEPSLTQWMRDRAFIPSMTKGVGGEVTSSTTEH